ncbi:unnamed protein product [Gadus morhua 'NCC']
MVKLIEILNDFTEQVGTIVVEQLRLKGGTILMTDNHEYYTCSMSGAKVVMAEFCFTCTRCWSAGKASCSATIPRIV